MSEALPVPAAIGTPAAGASRGRLLVVLLLIGAFLIVEVVGSVLTNSLALLADAGHMLTDAVGVGLALLAIWFGARPATIGKSFGYYRLEILAAAANAVLLFGMAAFILFEAVQRLRDAGGGADRPDAGHRGARPAGEPGVAPPLACRLEGEPDRARRVPRGARRPVRLGGGAGGGRGDHGHRLDTRPIRSPRW